MAVKKHEKELLEKMRKEKEKGTPVNFTPEVRIKVDQVKNKNPDSPSSVSATDFILFKEDVMSRIRNLELQVSDIKRKQH